MITITSRPWGEPCDYAHAVLGSFADVALLFSALRTSYSGASSLLAWDVLDVIEAHNAHDAWAWLHDFSQHPPEEAGTWIGYLSYEAGYASPPPTKATCPAFPIMRFVRYRFMCRFDHVTQSIFSDDASWESLMHCAEKPRAPTPMPCPLPHATMMPPDAYLDHVRDAQEHIAAGSFYQVNLTRKESGQWHEPLTPLHAWALFTRLCARSPAPYSAFISHKDSYILSSSPELFVELDAHGHISSRPIKGTLGREHASEDLHRSEKNRAENLMIVDLVRHDLAQVARVGSVKVPELYSVDSFRTVHHLSSQITAQQHPDATLATILRALFPAGSMTGAPKRAAMRWIAEHEGVQRGVYSGALGWITPREAMLNVVIRTLIATSQYYEYQIGGGIVMDSDPHDEYTETCIKARGLERMLYGD
ncbi:MAG: anthranilate synthase component I family protein [Alphaproteobacteria bacterium]|nr:MAG: anthranilate synthase component I family protein [Alphaproteobacteria bacterium]TAF39328.1 MAG: anthranilate synthase component I family protein [Alphaproteobacteria bacterium]TAF76915.1 MAG: anthranilate synthase component I family protein [Alphaproteobacteria bacterium]